MHDSDVIAQAIELPVEWFDAPEPDGVLTNNDLDPTEPDPFHDYQGPSMWEEYIPHPDMEGTTCGAGFAHEYHRWRRRPVDPVGIAKLPVPRHWETSRYD